MSLRLFIGIFPPPAIQREIAAVHQTLDDRPRGRWVQPDLLHMTLCFLGDCEAENLPALAGALDRAAGRHAPFELVLAGIRAFPNPARARVAFLAARGGETELAALAQSLVGELPRTLRPEDDKPFRAHLTIARFRDAPSRAAWALLEQAYANQGEPWRVRVYELRLVESELSAQGPHYRARHRAVLKSDGTTESGSSGQAI